MFLSNQSNIVTNTSSVPRIHPFSMPGNVKTLMVVGYSLLFVSGVLGNSFVICATLLRQSKRPATYNLLILSLAIADSLGSFFAPVIMISHLKAVSWRFVGSIGCKMLTSTTLLCSLASAWTIVVISLSRSSILKNTSLTKKRCNATTVSSILFAWFVAVVVTLPYTIKVGISRSGKCGISWSHEQNFQCSIVFLAFTSIIPILILCWAHITSIKKFRRSSTEARKQFGFKRTKQIHKITKLLSVITITFFVLTTPYSCFYMVIAYKKRARDVITNPQVYIYLYHALYLLSCLNFIINPFIYAQNFKITRLAKKVIGLFTPKKQHNECHNHQLDIEQVVVGKRVIGHRCGSSNVNITQTSGLSPV